MQQLDVKANFANTITVDTEGDIGKNENAISLDMLPEPEPGQIVARGAMYFGASFRCLMGITPEGHYLVQDFTTSQGEKRTDPYILTSKEALYSCYFDFWEESSAPIEGEYVVWSEHGQKCVQGQFVHGLKSGTWEYWSVDGQKVLEENYKNGLLDGKWTRWTYGTKSAQGNYALGKRHGVWREWWFNGQPSMQGVYYAGLCHGEWTWWRRDGLKLVQGYYDIGRKCGLWRRWDIQGKLKGKKNYNAHVVCLMEELREKYGIIIDWDKTQEQELLMRQRLDAGSVYGYNSIRYVREFLGLTPQGHYVVQDFYTEGDEKFTDPYVLLGKEAVFKKDFEFWSKDWLIHGRYVQWHLNGHKRMEMHFEDGQRQGPQTIWDKQGGKESEKTFKNDKLNGFYCTWYPDGQIQEKRYYLNDLRTGLWVKWWGNGQKQYQGTYQNDMLQGQWEWWFSDGVLRASGSYSNGFKTGLWQWWNEKKQLVDSHNYNTEGDNAAQWLEREFGIILDMELTEQEKLNSENAHVAIGYRFEVHDADFVNTYDRMFLGITVEGFNVVQDFYWDEGDRKRTQPYVLQDRNTSALMYCEANDIQRCGIDGWYKQWFANGSKEFEGRMENGCPVGVWRWWSTNGLLLKETDYGDGNIPGVEGKGQQAQTTSVISSVMKNVQKNQL